MSPKARPEGEYGSAEHEGTAPGESSPADHVPSPCISVCVLDAGGRVCTGCFRTLEEIAAWGTLDVAAKRRILTELPQRKTSGRLK